MKLRVNTSAVARILFILMLAGGFSALSSSRAVVAQTTTEEASPSPTPPMSVEERAARSAWRSTLIRKPAPKQGCFHLTYPNTEWQEAPCRDAPNIPYPMKTGIRMEMGNGQTFVAQSAAGGITEAVGQFPVSASMGISETGAAGANDFSLQLNANQFDSPACNPPAGTAKSDDCKGWEQFIYSNLHQGAFVQYWLIGYFDNRSTCPVDSDVAHGGCCPTGWTAFKPSAAVPGAAGCYTNSKASSPATPVINLTSQALLNLNLLGRVGAGSDSFTISTFDISQDMYTGSGLGDPLGLNGLWTAAEFNIFGDANSSNANFSPGTTFNVWIDIGAAATCATPLTGVTAETNNLTAVKGDEGPCCAWAMPGGHGGIQFTQSNAGATKSVCDAADYCIKAGDACSAGGVGCCATYGEHYCSNGRCVPVPPVLTCNGTRQPSQTCSSSWHCCDKAWVCGECQ